MATTRTPTRSILVLHGPNLNLLGAREPAIYGSDTLSDIDARLHAAGASLGFEVRSAQSNHEGGLIDALHDARTWAAGVILNPGGYGHTSVLTSERSTTASLPSRRSVTVISCRAPILHAESRRLR